MPIFQGARPVVGINIFPVTRRKCIASIGTDGDGKEACMSSEGAKAFSRLEIPVFQGRVSTPRKAIPAIGTDLDGTHTPFISGEGTEALPRF